MREHRVTHKRVTRRETDAVVTYDAGDVFEPTDAELAAFGDRLSPVEADTDNSGNDGDDDDESADSLVARLDGLTIPEVEDALASGEYDHELDAIAETDDRKGVQQAVDARLEAAFDELAEDSSDDD